MKKTSVFFMKLLVITILFSFSGQSSAFELPGWTSKPVEWVRHVAKWFGYEDENQNHSDKASSAAESMSSIENTALAANTNDMADQIDAGLYNFKDTVHFSNGLSDYGIYLNGPSNSSATDLYGMHGKGADPLLAEVNYDPLILSPFEQYLNGYYTKDSSLTARFSYNLPFLSVLHQGLAPSVSIESSYRFESSRPLYSVPGLKEAPDYSWKTGISYKGKNMIHLPATPVGINWGIGYDFKVEADDYDSLDGYKPNEHHSGSIFAGSYWYNLKLYTMFMYLYDNESREGTTIFNATYSPNLRWTYGIRAQFHNRKKNDLNNKEIIKDSSELMSFTATYRWD